MDPYFEVATANVRGFDLGDDELLEETLEAQRAQSGDLSATEWLLFAVLKIRHGDIDIADAALERVANEGQARPLALYLQSQLALGRDDVIRASELLEQADHANRIETWLPTAELVHAMGSIAQARGDLENALVLYQRGLTIDRQSAGRWLAVGELLLRLGRIKPACEAILHAVELEPDHREALYRLALAHASHGDADGTAQWLSTLLQRHPRSRRRAAIEPLFAAIDDPRIQELLDEPPPPDLEWLDRLGLGTFRLDPAVQRVSLRWMSQADSEAMSARLQTVYERGPIGTMHTPATLKLSRVLLNRARPIAYGPASTTRDGVEEPIVLFIDARRPHRMYLALSESYPPFLWVEFVRDTASFLEVLADFFPKPRLTRLDMTRTARGFMGYRSRFGVPGPYSGRIEPAGIAEVDRHFRLNPFVENASWGSNYADDPWPDDIPEQPGYVAKVAAHQREMNQQAEGSVWSVTRRTRHSRSYLSIEIHHHDLFVAEVRYRPSRYTGVVARMNEHFGCDYPEDMPLDAIAALLGFQFDAAEDLITRLDATSDTEEIIGLLTVLSTLLHSDLRMVRYYRRYMSHPDPLVRTTLCNIFAAYNFESLLEEMSLAEPDPDIRNQLEQLLDNGIQVNNSDPYVDAEFSDGDADKDSIPPS